MGKSKIQITKGYKVTDSNLQCRGFQFELNKVFTESGRLSICNNGFHFCEKANDCFNYYNFDSSNRVFEVEAYGEVETNEDKSCALEIKLIRELTWPEVLNTVNIGKNNTGRANTGDRNTGDSNTGNWNTGDSNTGNWNTGNWNTGYSNTGDRNTGDSNTGNWNTGNWNTGYRNTGNWNTGNWNTGYSNTGDRNAGAFCTGENTIKLFNKDSNWTIQEFENSKVYSLLCDVDTKLWIMPYQMTEAEKQAHPSYETCDGYLRDIPFKEAFQNAWGNWSKSNQKVFTSLPNFDAEIFEQITGVKV